MGTRLHGSYVKDDNDDDLHQKNNYNIIYNGDMVCFRYILENTVQMVIVNMIKITIFNINTALFAK